MSSNNKIHLSYTLETEDSVLELVTPEQNFVVELGKKIIHPALEKIIANLEEDSAFEHWLDPSLCFGSRDENLAFEIHQNKISRLLPDWKIGMSFEAPGPDSKPKRFRILSTDGTRVSIDGNHPLAGVALKFSGKVLKRF